MNETSKINNKKTFFFLSRRGEIHGVLFLTLLTYLKTNKMSTEIIDLSKVKLADWNIQAMTGYEPKTTFYTDFSIADHFGLVAINDTFKRAFESWKDNVIYLTELTMVMNWKCFEHYERQNMEFSQKYCALFETLDDYCRTNLKGEDLQYYYRTTD